MLVLRVAPGAAVLGDAASLASMDEGFDAEDVPWDASPREQREWKLRRARTQARFDEPGEILLTRWTNRTGSSRSMYETLAAMAS